MYSVVYRQSWVFIINWMKDDLTGPTSPIPYLSPHLEPTHQSPPPSGPHFLHIHLFLCTVCRAFPALPSPILSSQATIHRHIPPVSHTLNALLVTLDITITMDLATLQNIHDTLVSVAKSAGKLITDANPSLSSTDSKKNGTWIGNLPTQHTLTHIFPKPHQCIPEKRTIEPPRTAS